MHRRFVAGRGLLRQFFDFTKALGLDDLVELEDSPVVSRASLPCSSPKDSSSPSPLSPREPPSTRKPPSRRSHPSPLSPVEPSSPPSLRTSSLSSLAPAQCQEDQVQEAAPASPPPPQGKPSSADDPQQQQTPSSSAFKAPMAVNKLREYGEVNFCPFCKEQVLSHNFARHILTHQTHHPLRKSCNLCGAKIGRGDHLKRHLLKRCPR